MSTIINKGNLKPIPTTKYEIMTGDVVKYLQDQLGFGVCCDFTRWTGVTIDHSYVRMRVVFSPNDIISRSTSRDYVDRVLEQNAAGMMFKDNVIDTLKPYLYPTGMEQLRNHPDVIEKLYKLGVYNERFAEIMRFSTMQYCRDRNVFCIYLRPERIITDMLSDPSTGEVDGKLEIVAVYGTTSDTIKWIVNVTKSTNGMPFGTNISVDAVFNSF